MNRGQATKIPGFPLARERWKRSTELDQSQCWVDVEGTTKTAMYCFAADGVADLLDELLHGTLVCAVQIKVYGMPFWDPDDDRRLIIITHG